MNIRFLVTQRGFLGFSGAVAFLCLAFAFYAQYFLNVNPCVLCLYERYLYGAVVLLGMGSLSISYYRLAFNILGGVLAFGCLLSIYHLGVELHWWQGTAACHGVTQQAKNIEELRALLRAKPMARCDQANWFILGMSATYLNVIWFMIFSALWHIVRRQDKC
ncbi:disulfide bond formation protein B [Candidatus Odyssella thessalonicensis]|uniref:disulfide bond formation protein B n=1 Tax=Candidatus Odyssella thessalonicensis TaxID=84647 RepID=UPI000225B6D6|nr:disulfide bond formation protein B [Candidatus Odyssella thessalonicensis]